MPPQHQQVAFRLCLFYRLFFLLIEPVSALVGAFYAHYRQASYLGFLDAQSAAVPPLAPGNDAASPLLLPPSTSVTMSQLANMHVLFALTEALVLRSTCDMR
ncbi:hypothetical protein E4U53_001409, partial [Claviceps sorghi]